MRNRSFPFWKTTARYLAMTTRLCGWTAAALAIMPLTLHAQNSYPSKPLRIIVTYQAGGLVDTMARALADGLGKRLDQPVIVENKPGAGGIIATDYVAKAAPDGYTLLLAGSTPLAASLALYKKLPYDPRTDLRPISDIAMGAGALVVSSALPVKTVGDLIAYAKKEPGKLTIGSWGAGSTPHIIQNYMNKTYGIDILLVPYKGEAPIVMDLLAGQINMAYVTTYTLRQHIASGKIRPLAVLGTKRINALPDVPTMAEAGYNDKAYQTIMPITLLAPAKTPPEIVERLGREVSAAVKSPAVSQKLVDMDLEPIGNLPQQAESAYKTSLPVILKLVTDTGVTLD